MTYLPTLQVVVALANETLQFVNYMNYIFTIGLGTHDGLFMLGAPNTRTHTNFVQSNVCGASTTW